MIKQHKLTFPELKSINFDTKIINLNTLKKCIPINKPIYNTTQEQLLIQSILAKKEYLIVDNIFITFDKDNMYIYDSSIYNILNKFINNDFNYLNKDILGKNNELYPLFKDLKSSNQRLIKNVEFRAIFIDINDKNEAISILENLNS